MISCIITRLFTALPSFGFLSSSAFHLYFGLHPHSSITGAGVLDGYKGLWGELLIQVRVSYMASFTLLHQPVRKQDRWFTTGLQPDRSLHTCIVKEASLPCPAMIGAHKYVCPLT